MSVSKWAYDPAVCDGEPCVGDCDLCEKPKNMEDEPSDYISRQAVIDYLDSNNMPWRDWVEDIPSADVVEVVRCMDCRYWQNYNDVMVCGLTNAMMSINDYCSFGERAET